jgi:hypothetical protein
MSSESTKIRLVVFAEHVKVASFRTDDVAHVTHWLLPHLVFLQHETRRLFALTDT